MKNKKLKMALLFGVPVLIGGYLIYKQLKGNKKSPIKIVPLPPKPVEPEVGWEKYKVITLVHPLNIREQPSVLSKDLGDLPIGTIIWAKPSSTSGWHEYSDDGSTRAGYVSSTYITKV